MRLTAAASPHIRGGDNVRVAMGDVVVLLIPLVAMSVFFYGWRTLILVLISCAASVAAEIGCRRLMRRTGGGTDFSAVITGAFVALCVPATAPLWMPAVGSVFAVVVVKQLFGGIGKNIFNPSAAGTAFLMVAWPGVMSAFPQTFNRIPLLATPHGFETGRAVQAALRSGILPDNHLYEMLIGDTPGNLGTGCILILLIGAAYLLYRRIINWQIPAAFLGTVAVFAAIFPRSPSGRLDSVWFELTSGSLVFVALLMATDPVTSPVTSIGRLLFGCGCGLFTVLLRYFGTYPEGAFFAVLLMNPFVLALDRLSWHIRMKGGKLLYAKE